MDFRLLSARGNPAKLYRYHRSDMAGFTTTMKGYRKQPSEKWVIKDDVLIKDGEPVADFRSVTGGVYQYSRGRSLIYRRLTIESSLGTAVIASVKPWRKELDTMLQLSTKVLEGIAQRSPHARIHISGGRMQVIAHFFVALCVIGTGIWIWTKGDGQELYLILCSIAFSLVGIRRAFLTRPWNDERFFVSAEQVIPALPKGPYGLWGIKGLPDDWS